MFQVLVESRATSQRRGSWTALSIAAHSAVVALAVVLTAQVAPEIIQSEVTHVVYNAPPAPVQTSTPVPIGAITPIVIDRFQFAFPSLPIVLSPTPDPLARVLDDFGPSTIGAVPGTRVGNDIGATGVHTEATVDRIVAALPGNPSPAYPKRLSSASLDGDVLVRFVVDTTGRVEPTSVEIVHASHDLFGESVKQWLRLTRYSPAQAGGRPVRQLVQQRVGFNLQR